MNTASVVDPDRDLDPATLKTDHNVKLFNYILTI